MAATAQPPLRLGALLGMRTSVTGGLAYLDETDVQYVSGRNVVRYDTETRLQRIVPGTLEASVVTAVATSPNRRMTAFAEFTSECAVFVTLYEWQTKRRRRIVALDHGRSPVTHLCFSCDGRNLIVQTGAPDWTMHYVAWEKGTNGKVLAALRNVAPVTKSVAHVEGHPVDPALIATSGRGFVRLFRFQDDALKAVPINLRRDPGLFSCHAWLPDDRLVLGTAGGDLWFVEGTEFKRILDSGPPAPDKRACVIQAFSKGFIVGGERGSLRLFERSEDTKFFFKLSKVFSVAAGELSRVVAIALSPNEEDLCASCSSGQAYTFKLASYELYKDGDAAMFRPLVTLFHGLNVAASTGAMDDDAADAEHSFTAPLADPSPTQATGITGLDVCSRKPVFVTCGADRTVRLWSYSTTGGGLLPDSATGGGTTAASTMRKGSLATGGFAGEDYLTPTLELVQRFGETPSCVALHPTGLTIVVGFESALQLMNVLMDSIRLYKEFPIRNCSEVRFSHGGSMFAAISSTAISVYGTYTCALIATLRGHADKVVSFVWTRDDRHIVSVGRDGLVVRFAVVVPNASSAAAAALAASGPGGSAAPPSAVSGGVPAVVVPGKVLHQVELKECLPLAIANGASDSGRDVYVSAVLNHPGNPPRGVLRHVDLTAQSVRDAVKVDAPLLRGESFRALHQAQGGRMLVAGLGHSLERPPPAALGTTVVAAGTTVSAAGLRTAGDAHAASATATLEHGIVGAATTTVKGLGATAAAVPAATAESALASTAACDLAGVIRVYRTPGTLAGDFFDLVCHGGPVSRVAVTPDDKLVITGAADGSVALTAFPVDTRSKVVAAVSGSAASGAGSAAATSDERLPWAEEILVTKSDLEEVRRERVELEARVQEISMTNKYNERYKDMTNEEKIREIEEKFAEELRADRSKHDTLRGEKSEMEARFEEEIGRTEQAHASELEELEATYRAKITAEMERYDALVKERDRVNADQDTANAGLVREHAREIDELKAAFEAAIREEVQATAELEARKRALQGECGEVADDVEQDADREIEDVRARFEAKLLQERKATENLRRDNRDFKQTFVVVNDEIAAQKEDMARLADKERELHDAIIALQKDVQGHKKEIRDREETVVDKEARIYDLRKKNQELEKFKFVLNYKIQELKRQILPRKREIQDMREQMKEMELELLQYHKSNAALDLMIGELKLKRDGMQREVDKLRAEITTRTADLTKIARDVVAVHAVVHDAKALRIAITRLYHRYIHGEAGSMASAVAVLGGGSSGGAEGASSPGRGGPTEASTGPADGADAAGSGTRHIAPVGVDAEDLQAELARQRQHLERNLESLRRKVTKEAQAGALDHARLMRENTALTQEINDLRRDLRFMQQEVVNSRELARQAAAKTTAAGLGGGSGSMVAGGSGSTPRMPLLLSAGVTSGAVTGVARGALPGSTGSQTQQPSSQQQQRGRRTAALLGVLVAAPGTAIRPPREHGSSSSGVPPLLDGRPPSEDQDRVSSSVFPRIPAGGTGGR